MKKLFSILFIIPLLCLGQQIIPTPENLILTNQEFKFKPDLYIKSHPKSSKIESYISDFLEPVINLKHKEKQSNVLELQINKNLKSINDEGYFLTIRKKKIIIEAKTEAGLFYGVQSLLQLLPKEVYAKKNTSLNGYVLQTMQVKDQPKYSWRGLMLDSGRQYQSPDFIKRFLDQMAMLKLNVFHWHLTEGQGWRIEIKKYPKLTSIGSKVASGPQQQGYYTQEEIKAIVNYAADRHIRVVPEIDLPGHSEAALNAYPEFSCFNEAPKSVMSFSSTIFCGGKPETYTFIKSVLDEVCELFPSEYIHLGGDEAPKNNWDRCNKCQQIIEEEKLKDSHDLQLYFSTELANYLKTKNKKAIFWGDVVYEKGVPLPDNSIIQWWNYRRHKTKGLNNAIAQGHEVICNSNYYTYLNFPVTPWSKYKTSRTFDVKDIYNHNPSHIDNPDPLIKGMSAALWTDWHVTEEMIDQRLFPRIYALSEQMWHKGDLIPFEKFYELMQSKYPLLNAMEINYGPALKTETPKDYKWD